MVPFASLAPKKIKSLLERVGYEVIDEDDYHWAFASRPDEVPVLVPKKVMMVPAEVVRDVISKTGAERFTDYLYEITSPWDEPEGDEPGEPAGPAEEEPSTP